MPRQLKANRVLVGRSLFLLLVGSIFIVTAEAPAISAQTARQIKASQSSQSAVVTEALKASFGSSLEAVTAFQPFYLTGDFNGDGAQDVVIVVRLKGRRRELPTDVKILNPFGYGAKATFPVDPSIKPALAFAIIHGARNGWQTSAARGRFLLLGESPVLILENDRATSSQPEDRKNLMEIIRKRGKRVRGATRPPATAKGDSILLGTEAAESILYWNGKTYRWQESEGGE